MSCIEKLDRVSIESFGAMNLDHECDDDLSRLAAASGVFFA
jgi:hypothetical protein